MKSFMTAGTGRRCVVPACAVALALGWGIPAKSAHAEVLQVATDLEQTTDEVDAVSEAAVEAPMIFATGDESIPVTTAEEPVSSSDELGLSPTIDDDAGIGIGPSANDGAEIATQDPLEAPVAADETTNEGVTEADTDTTADDAAPTDGQPSATPMALQVSTPEATPLEAKATHALGWAKENGSYFWYERKSNGTVAKRTEWLVTTTRTDGKTGTLERYWLDQHTGALILSRLLDPTKDGLAYFAYAKNDGTIVRGRYTDPSTGIVYLANNDGRLESPGWHVTKAYGQGLQRYWVDEQAHGCVPGYSADGYPHYTTSAGYVLRAKKDTGRGLVYVANNDGRLLDASEDHWVVTKDFDKGWQRYWVVASRHAVRTGVFEVEGQHYYGIGDEGYVLRGKKPYQSGMLLADNNGVLAWDEGWLCTGIYDHGKMQRYRIDTISGTTVHGAHLGHFSVGGSTYYGSRAVGYVIRNTYDFYQKKWWHVNNDGKFDKALKVGKVGYQNPKRYPQIDAYGVTLPSYCKGFYTYVLPCTIRPDYTREQCVEAFIAGAMKYFGTKWVDNRASRPGDTIDCSGLIMEGLYAAGVSLDGLPSGDYNPWTKAYTNHHFANSWRENNVFMPVDFSQIKRGDIVYWYEHVAIYLGNGVLLDGNSVDGKVAYNRNFHRYGPVLGAARPFV